MKNIKFYFFKLIDPAFVTLIFSFCVLSLLSINLKIFGLSSVFFYLSLFSVFLWLFTRCLIKRFRPTNKKLFVAVAVSCLSLALCSIISILYSKSSINGNSISYIVILFATFVSLYLTITGQFNKYVFYFITTISLVYSCALVGLYITGYARVWQSIRSYSLLTLNFSNANLAGVVLSCVIFADLIGVFIFRHLLCKLFSIALAIMCFALLVLTTSRNPFIATAFSFVFALFVLIDKKKRFTNSISLMIMIMPLVFISAYFIYFKIKVPDGNIISYIAEDDLGKPLTSRFFIWCNFFYLSKRDAMSFLFGNYSLAGNCHNSSLTLLYCYGLFGFLFGSFAFVILLNAVINCNRRKTISQFYGYLYVFSIFFLGLAEATPVITSNGSFAFLLVGVLLTKIPLSKSLFAEKCETKRNENPILVISNVYGNGSIGKIVRDCHHYFLKNGLNAYVAYGRGEQVEDKNVVSLESVSDVLFTKFIMKVTKLQFVGSYLMTSELLKCIDDIKPEIVHITALNDQYVNPKRLLNYLHKKRIKVVYTHHSEYMYLGACGGHAYRCETFFNNCYSCASCSSAISRKIYDSKLKLISKFDFNHFATTSVSPWLQYRAANSQVFNGKRNYVVMNGSSIGEECCKLSKKQILSRLNVSEDKKIILHVTPSMLITTKKSSDFINLSRLNPNLEFVILTYNADKNITLPNNLHIIENVSDSSELASFYSAASLTVLTGTSETFSMPVIESLLCGTPVLGYECGGPESIAIAEYSTFVKNGDLEALNCKLNDLINKKINNEEIIKLAKQRYSTKSMAEGYIKVYKELGFNPTFTIEI